MAPSGEKLFSKPEDFPSNGAGRQWKTSHSARRFAARADAFGWNPELQVTHLKRWNLASLLRTDIFDRAMPWTELMLRNRAMPNDLNLRVEQRFCVMLVCLAPILAPRFPASALLALALAIALNHALYGFFAARRGWWFAIRAVPMHLLYFFYSGAAMAAALAWFAVRTEPLPVPEAETVRSEPGPWTPKIGLDARTPPR